MTPRLPAAAGPPLPTRQIISQFWADVTFIHWRIDPALVADRMPPGVRPDIHDGSTWVGLVPFRMVGAGVGHGPATPYLGTFPETNVRLYSVDDAGRRGIVFLSLEASRLPVVLGARMAFNLPYQWARMTVHGRGRADGMPTAVSYTSRRRLRPRPAPGGRIDVDVGAAIAEPSALAVFLTSRFGLHTSVLRRTVYVPNSHRPWPLYEARVTGLTDSLVAAAGLPGIADQPPESVLFSPGVRTVFGLPYRADREI